MNGGRFDALARALMSALPRRGVYGVFATLLGLCAGAVDRLENGAAARNKNTRQHRQKRQKRRRRRRAACRLLPSGAACGESAQCCSGTCDENTAFPLFDRVCCRVLGESCVIGRDECCLDFACHCTGPDCVDFNGDAGVCG